MSDPEKLFEANQKLALAIAGRIARRLRHLRISQADLDNAALVGLWQASRRFRPDRKVRFSTYAAPRIHGEVIDWVRRCDHLSRSHRRNGGVRLVAMPTGTSRHGDECDIEPPDHSDPAAEPQADDTLRCLLGVLTPAERRCVWLCHVRGLTMRLVIARLRVSESSVSKYLAAAREKMRQRLAVLEDHHA